MNLNYKSLFFVPEGIYLANHSMGCLPHDTKAAVDHTLALWQQKGSDAWTKWLEDIEIFHNQLAIMFNAKSHEFCHQVNVTSGVSKILGSLPKRPRRTKILTSSLDFPSITYQFEIFQQCGYELIQIPAKDGIIELDEWESHLQDDVQLAFISHVSSKNNFRSPIKEITEVASKKQIFTLVDIAQSAGIIPIDFSEWSATFIVGTCLKWLCSATGAGFLWVSDSFISDFKPIDVGWFSEDNPFEVTVQHKFSYAKDARRYYGGTPSVIPCIIAGHSLAVLNNIGVQEISEHNQSLIQLLIEELQSDFIIVSPIQPQRRGGSLCLKFSDPLTIFDLLAEKKITLEFRKIIGPNSYLRISPHIYNSAADIHEMIAALRSCLSKRVN